MTETWACALRLRRRPWFAVGLLCIWSCGGGGTGAKDADVQDASDAATDTAPRSCMTAADCPSGFCVDGYCCDSACDGACQSCGLPGSKGTCSPVTTADDPDTCTKASTCDSAGLCKTKGGESCGADGDCASAACNAGFCCADARHCVVSAAAGVESACVITLDRRLWCWGNQGMRQVGDGTTPEYGTISPRAPTLVALPPGTTAVQVQSDFLHTCAVTDGGQVWCWGVNDDGQLGNGATTMTDSPAATKGLGSGAVEVATG